MPLAQNTNRRLLPFCIACWSLLLTIGHTPVCSQSPLPPALLQEEQARIALAKSITPPTVAIFDPAGEGGGSGVIVSEAGLVVTNFHVTAPCGPAMLVGLSDGRLLRAVLVGIDPCGDIALVQLLEEAPHTPATLGNSDRARVGDEVIVAGNPFLLAEDFRPTLTYGVLSGTHRYQPPSGSLLEYTDCLQTDAAINPGNSGGPLYSKQGLLIGINGRGSFEKRGRVSVGVGYAVSMNQVQRFLPLLSAGLRVDHASLGATVRTQFNTRTRQSTALVDAVDRRSDAYRRGLRPGDEIIQLDDRPINTANELLNAIGISPPGWRVQLRWMRKTELYTAEVRLEPLHGELELREEAARMESAAKMVLPTEGGIDWHPYYEAHPDYANRYFNRRQLDQVLSSWSKPVPLEQQQWVSSNGETVSFAMSETELEYRSTRSRATLELDAPLDAQPLPARLPGLLAALWIEQQLANAPQRLDEVRYAGKLPWRTGEPPVAVVQVRHRGVRVEFSFANSTGNLLGWEIWLASDADPLRLEHRADGQFNLRQGDKTLGRYRQSLSKGEAP